MIKIRKLEHGDRLKLLPFYYENNLTMSVGTDFYLFGDRKIYHDIGGKLKKYLVKFERRPSRRYLFLTYDSNGEILYTYLPQVITRKLSVGNCDINSTTHLRIYKGLINGFPDYSNTYICEDNSGWSYFDKKDPSLKANEILANTGINIANSSTLVTQYLKSNLDLILENFNITLEQLNNEFPVFSKQIRKKKIEELLWK